jgi:hypothetical protein
MLRLAVFAICGGRGKCWKRPGPKLGLQFFVEGNAGVKKKTATALAAVGSKSNRALAGGDRLGKRRRAKPTQGMTPMRVEFLHRNQFRRLGQASTENSLSVRQSDRSFGREVEDWEDQEEIASGFE